MNLDDELSVLHYFPTEGNPVYMRRMQAHAGLRIGSHKHTYEHYSILCSGKARVTYAEETEEHIAPSVMVVPAGVEHCIEALTDIVWLCVHGTAETDRDSIDEVLIAKGE